MKRFHSQKKKTGLKVWAAILCASMLLSMPGTSNIAYATESDPINQTSTDNVSSNNSNIDANGVLGKNSDIGVELEKSITGKAGKEVTISFAMTSSDEETIKLKSIYPVVDNSFPFETSGDAYKVVTAGKDEDKQKKLDAEFKMTARTDIETGYHSIRFIGEYKKFAQDGTSEDFYIIKTMNIYFTSKADSATESTTESKKKNESSSGNKNNSSSNNDDDDDDDDDSGSSYSGGYSSYSSGDSDEADAPKLIIKGFETTPERVMAGDTFKLKVHLQNTSKKIDVCNGKFMIGNEAGNFLPVAGSSAIYVEKIAAGETGDLEIELKTSADLAQKSYVLVVKGEYDDGKGSDFTYSGDNLYLPVYQDVKLNVTDVSMTPESIGIGSTGTLMFTINNQGSASVNNVSVAAKDDAVTATESYVGNIAGNSSAYATLEVMGAVDNMDKGTIKVVISYEDAEGTKGTIEQDIACLVGVDAEVEDDEDWDDEDWEEEEGIPTWLIIVAAVLAAVVLIVVIVVVVKKRKKKLAALLEEEDEDEENGEDLFEDENV